MFGTIRLIFWCFIFSICIFLMKKCSKFNKKNVVILTIIMVVFCTLSGMVPIENYFITFTEPERAFNYINSEKVVLVVEGKDSTFVIGERNKASYVHLILPKCENGWKLGRGIDTKLKEQTMIECASVYLYQYSDTNDYYISILDMTGEGLEIVDSCNSSFVTFDDEEMNIEYVSYFTNLSQYDENYWININGQKVSFTK